jgi:hypothetical protein
MRGHHIRPKQISFSQDETTKSAEENSHLPLITHERNLSQNARFFGQRSKTKPDLLAHAPRGLTPDFDENRPLRQYKLLKNLSKHGRPLHPSAVLSASQQVLLN